MTSETRDIVDQPVVSVPANDRVLRLLLVAMLVCLVIWTLALVLPRFYRIPASLDLSHRGINVGLFAEEARTVVTGVLYRDVWGNKPPGMFMIMSLFVRLFGNTGLAIGLSALFMDVYLGLSTAALAYVISGSRKAAVIGGAFAFLYAARINLPETTLAMAGIGATAMTLALAGRGRLLWMLASGALFTYGVMTKQPLLFELPILLAFAAVRAPRGLSNRVRAVAGVVAGVALCVAAFAAWTLWNGSAQSLWFHVFGSVGSYVFRTDGQWKFSQEGLDLFRDYFLGATLPEMSIFFLLAAGAAALLLRKRGRDPLVWITIAWVFATFIAASVPRGMTPQYYRQMLPALIGLMALAVPVVEQMSLRRQVLFSGLALAGAVWYGVNWLGFSSFTIRPPEGMAAAQPVVETILARTEPDDCLWPWGDLLFFSYLTERKSCVAASYDGYLMDSSAFPVAIFRVEFMHNLFDHPPALHILDSPWGYFKEQQKFVDRYLGPIIQTSGPYAVFSVDMSKFHRTNVNFGNEIALFGYDLPPEDAYCPGDSLQLAMTWERLSTPKHQYQLFAQLVTPDEAAQVASYDGVPAERRPTNTWVDGAELVLGLPFALQIPADTAPGTYRLIAGLYDVVTRERLNTLGADGQPDGSYARLQDVTVKNCSR